jgi:hypothetical protein
MSFSVRWDIPAEAQLIPNLNVYDHRIKRGLGMLAHLFAKKMEGEARAGAPWNDVTGAARGGLIGEATVAATQVLIELAHTVHYGPYLELGTSKMAPRPIILPVLQANYPEVWQAVIELLA